MEIFRTLEEAVEEAKKQVILQDCLQVVRETVNGLELMAVKEEVDITPDFRALVAADELSIFTHTEKGIVTDVMEYTKIKQ